MSENDAIPKISEYATVKEAAEILNISDKMVYFYIENRRLRAVRASNLLLIPLVELENFKQKSVGRPRTKTPAWRISSKDNALFVTAIRVQIRAEQQDQLQKKLEHMRREGLHDFPGTIARYIIGYEKSPDKLEILLIWKTSVTPAESAREEVLEAFRQALTDVLDWNTAEYDDGTVFMHT